MQLGNNVSPNFGMALKITPGGKEYIRRNFNNTKNLDELAQMGKDLRKTKHWDVILNESGFNITHKRNMISHFEPFRIEYDLHNNYLMLHSKTNETRIQYQDTVPAMEAYIKIKAQNGKIPRIANITREIDKASDIVSKETTKTKQVTNESKLDELMKIYGIDTIKKFNP